MTKIEIPTNHNDTKRFFKVAVGDDVYFMKNNTQHKGTIKDIVHVGLEDHKGRAEKLLLDCETLEYSDPPGLWIRWNECYATKRPTDPCKINFSQDVGKFSAAFIAYDMKTGTHKSIAPFFYVEKIDLLDSEKDDMPFGTTIHLLFGRVVVWWGKQEVGCFQVKIDVEFGGEVFAEVSNQDQGFFESARASGRWEQGHNLAVGIIQRHLQQILPIVKLTAIDKETEA